MSKNNNLSVMTKGILKENPVFVLVLGHYQKLLAA